MSPRIPRVSMKARALAYEQRLIKQVRLVMALSLLGGLIAGLMATWEWWFPESSQEVVKVYWMHSCKCVFGWMDTLEAEGFDVQSYEYETLKYERASLHMPTNFRGCHVGAFQGYFIEGHVAPSALRQLAREHPKGKGLVTQAVLTAEAEHVENYLDENSPVLLIDDSGQARRWFEPRN